MILSIFHKPTIEEPRSKNDHELDLALRKLRRADVYITEATTVFEQYIADFKRQRGTNE